MVIATVLAARGRGIALLIEAAMAGEWWAIGLVAVIVIGVGASIWSKAKGSGGE